MLRTLLSRRAREDAATRAFLSAIRVSAFTSGTAAYAAADEIDAARDDAHPLPMSLVTLMVQA